MSALCFKCTMYKIVTLWFHPFLILETKVISCYLEESYPVVAGPVVLRAYCVVAINSALREVTAANVPKLHWPILIHGNTKQWWVPSERGKRFRFLFFDPQMLTRKLTCIARWAICEKRKRQQLVIRKESASSWWYIYCV